LIIGVLRLVLAIHESFSLKDKRKVVKAILGQIKSRFNVAASETAMHDVWQRAELGLVVVGNHQPELDSVLNKLIDFVEASFQADIVSADMDFIYLNDRK